MHGLAGLPMKSICFGAMLTGLLAVTFAVDGSESRVGRTIADFTLHDYLGAKHSLGEWRDKKAVVVVFLGVECPLAKQYGPRLAELASKYASQGVVVVGIDANQQDSLAEIAHYARQHKIDFLLLKDPGNSVADQFGARRTPEVFILDANNTVRYWGRIDDQYGVGYARQAPTRNYVADALDDLLAGRDVREPVQEPVGCFIGRVGRSAPSGEVTYTKHVATILHRRCVWCHRSGEVAPFALTSYSEVVGWAETIREVIADGRMPPWHANSEHGKFLNDFRLPKPEKELLNTWIDNECPEGDAADLPQLPPFAEGWQIPKPEVVYRMPQPFNVPAKGVVEYQYFSIDPGWTEDKWIKAAEVRPGNRAVTHHLIAFFHPPGSDKFEPIEPLYNSIVGFAPGLPPSIYPEGTYRRIPKGSKIIIQAHYTPNGTRQTDQSELGLVFADPKTVKREMTVAAALNWMFRIPAGASDHRIEASHRFEQDTLLWALTPHMHLRGKSFRFVAHYPSGDSESLLDVPRYDFNWQNTYAFVEPKRLPAGTVIRCFAAYDNSESNLANPNPNAAVMWGDQTWQEMMVGSFAVSLVEQDLSLGLPRMKRLEGGDYEVTFTYQPPEKADAVYLAGNFNQWKPADLKMDGPDKEGRYTARLQLSPGRYEYKFVIDGKQWRSDPANPAHASYYRNSLLLVGQD
jgi:peroxiredoxin